MSEVRDFLNSNESVDDKVTSFNPELDIKYTIHTLTFDDTKSEDDVILEIEQNTEPCVLIGGNVLEISTLSGLGRLSIVDLGTGEKSQVTLEPGVSEQIPSHNTLYWYENLGTEPLFVRDHCDDFEQENEPSLQNVVDALITLS